MNAVLDVEPQHSIQRLKRNFLWFRRKRSGLAEGAAKTAPARRKQNTERERPSSRQAEACDQRWMLDFVKMGPQFLGQGVFTVTGEHMVKVRLDGRRQSTVISRPQLANACLSRFGGHRQDVVGLFEIKGKTHDIPAPLELRRKLGACGIFKDIQLRKILPQESQAKRYRPWHTETPAIIPGRILTEIIVEAGIAAPRCQQNSKQDLPPLRNFTQKRTWLFKI